MLTLLTRDDLRQRRRLLEFTTTHFTERLGIPCAPDWGILPHVDLDGFIRYGTCRCPRARKCGQSPGKHPILCGGRSAATFDVGELLPYIDSEQNVAAYPVDTVTLDVEGGAKDGMTSLRIWAELHGVDLAAMLRTFTTRSGGGGWHFHYRITDRSFLEFPPRGRDAWLPHVDVKTPAKGSDKVTVPGSLHESGQLYTFHTYRAGGEERIRGLAAAPVVLLDALAAGQRWEWLPERERPSVAPQPDGSVLVGDVLADARDLWRHARFLGPGEAAPVDPNPYQRLGSTPTA